MAHPCAAGDPVMPKKTLVKGLGAPYHYPVVSEEESAHCGDHGNNK